MKRIIALFLAVMMVCSFGGLNVQAAGSVTITFRGNGGMTADGLVTTTQQTTAGVSTRLDTNPFIREGYTFTGWSTSAASANGVYADRQAVGVNQNTTFYAIWHINIHELTVQGIEGFHGGEVEYGADLSQLLPEDPRRTGYRFTGWKFTNAEGEVIPQPQTMPDHDLTAEACWEEIGSTYILTLLDEQGEVIATYRYGAGDPIEEPQLSLPEGMRIRGWRDVETGKIQPLPAAMPARDVEFLVVLEEIYYTITFMDGTAEVGEVTAGYGEKGIFIDRPAQTGKEFLGWSRDPHGVTAEFQAWEEIDLSEDMTVYAVWTSVKPTVELKYPTLTFEDVIVMNIYYAVSDMENVQQMGLITFSEKVDDYSVETAKEVIPGYVWSEADGLYCSTTNGIAAKCLGDTIYFAVYYQLSDGSYGYSKLASYSPRTYAYNQLKTGSAEMRPLVVSMLNYGAAAQHYFSYHTDAPVNADLTADQLALVEGYRADMIGGVTQASGDKLGQFINDGTYTRRYPTISFEGAFCINFYFQPSQPVAGDVTMYLWSLEDFQGAQVLTKENATKAIPMTLTESGEYLGVADGIAAKELDKAVYASFVYSDGTTEHCGGVVAYTIGLYCKSQAAQTGALADLAAATAVYGYYAKQLFG